jgi:hypothetical protein
MYADQEYACAMTSNLTPDQEYALVYQGIVAVAAHCDGAQSLDYVGFDGQDTHFGRRIASVPFDTWTPAVREEAARIANKYQKQILTYTEVDVTTLQVVKDAKDIGTVRAARDDARTYERRARGASKVAARKVDVEGGQLLIAWVKGDPDFGPLLDAARALPGRRFNGNGWTAPVSDEVRNLILVWDFPVTAAAQALLDLPAVPQAAPAPNIVLEDASHVAITAGYDEAMLQPIRALPGRRWDAARKVNLAQTHPAVIRLAERFNLTMSPEARKACETGAADRQAAGLAAGDAQAIVAHVSRAKDPTTLPEAFEDMLAPVLARYGAEKALS